MPFDEEVASRLRAQLGAQSGVTERGLFGGTAFFIDGNLCVGVIRQDLVARIGPERFTEALERPGVRPFNLTGKPMSGWVMVAPAGYPNEHALTDWIREALEYVQTLPKQ